MIIDAAFQIVKEQGHEQMNARMIAERLNCSTGDEMSAKYGIENLMGLGCNWTDESIEYVIGLKNGTIPGADYEIDLPNKILQMMFRIHSMRGEQK